MKLQKLKRTEIGEIPEDWRVVRLGDETITEIRGNKSIKGFDKIAFIPMELITDSGVYVNYELRQIKDVKSFIYCELGDLLLAKITPSLENGKQGIVPEDIPNGFALATTEVFPISCKGINTLFLFYVLKYHKFRNRIIASMIGTTGRQRASKESVKNILIPLPPLSEQKIIAEFLFTFDNAIAIVERESQRIERLKEGLMRELFDKKRWKSHKVEEIFKVKTGTTPPTKELRYWEGGSINWITPADMSNMKNDLNLPESNRKITKNALEEVNLTLMPIGSIVISTRAPVGYVGIVNKELTFNQGCKGLIPKDKNKINTIFYAHYISSLKSYLNKISSGSTFKELSKDSLCKLEIPLPSIEEQNKISEILSILDKKLSIQSIKKSKLEEIKKGLMNELLTGEKRVNVEKVLETGR